MFIVCLFFGTQSHQCHSNLPHIAVLFRIYLLNDFFFIFQLTSWHICACMVGFFLSFLLANLIWVELRFHCKNNCLSFLVAVFSFSHFNFIFSSTYDFDLNWKWVLSIICIRKSNLGYTIFYHSSFSLFIDSLTSREEWIIWFRNTF